MKWLTDANGNRCSVEYFGSEAAAQKALDSLTNCSDCSDCSRCSYCSRCSRCSDCSGCSDCSDCSRCSECRAKSCIQGTDAPDIPSIENIHSKVYAAASAQGALAMDAWHTCEKKHCRAGWVVTLAGPAGRKAEEFYGTALASQLIYKASGYEINPCRFFDSDEDALKDMKRLAAGQ